jgi:hypothetical protein
LSFKKTHLFYFKKRNQSADQMIMNAIKAGSLLIIILLIVGCGTAKKSKQAVAPVPLSPVHVVLDPINDTRAILKYDRGDRIEGDGQKRAEEEIKKFCKARKHKILVDGERLSGDKKWTRIIVFECLE